MKKSVIFRICEPKSRLNWAVLWVLMFMGGVAIGPKLQTPKGFLLVLALTSLIVGLEIVVPLRWFLWWETRHPVLRGAVLGFLGYALMVTIGSFGELYTFRVWFELVFMTFKGAAPFSDFHTLGVVTAFYAYLSQRYYLVFSTDNDPEWVISGQAQITYEQAKQRAQELNRK